VVGEAVAEREHGKGKRLAAGHDAHHAGVFEAGEIVPAPQGRKQIAHPLAFAARVVEIDVDVEAVLAALTSSPLPPALCHGCDLACAVHGWHRRLRIPVDNAGLWTTGGLRTMRGGNDVGL